MTKKRQRLTVPGQQNRQIGQMAQYVTTTVEPEAIKAEKKLSLRSKVEKPEDNGIIRPFADKYKEYIENKVKDVTTIDELKEIIVEIAEDFSRSMKVD